MAQAANKDIVRSIPAPAGAVGKDCTHVTLWDAAADGNLLGKKQISTNPAPLVLDARYEIAAGALVITAPAGASETAAMARRAAAGKVAGGVWVQYHTGAPGAAGDANVIAGMGRTAIPQAGWTIT